MGLLILGVGAALYELAQRWEEIKAYFSAGEWQKFWGVMLTVFLETLNTITMGLSGWLLKLAGLGQATNKAEGDPAITNTSTGKAAALALAVGGMTATLPAAATNPTQAMQAARPPIAMAVPQPARAPGALGSGTYQITINAAPGMDEKALARAVTAELDRRERSNDARRLSRLSDID
jgi:hypothetical protein